MSGLVKMNQKALVFWLKLTGEEVPEYTKYG